jgi:hypothetical protein
VSSRQIDESRLRESIISSCFEQGFVLDLGNGIVLKTLEEWRIYQSAIAEVKVESEELRMK